MSLANALESGWRPPAVQAPIALFPGEDLYQSVDFALAEFSAQQVSYTATTMLAFGNPLFVVGSLAASAAVNSARRTAAQRAGAPQWRTVANGTMYVSSQRLGLQTMRGWWDVAYRDIRSLVPLSEGVAVFLDGRPPLRISVAWPEYFYVLLNFLAWNRVIRPNVPPPTTAIGPQS